MTYRLIIAIRQFYKRREHVTKITTSNRLENIDLLATVICPKNKL